MGGEDVVIAFVCIVSDEGGIKDEDEVQSCN
jgi:hypothetical protein